MTIEPRTSLASKRAVVLPDGAALPPLGLGTWRMGETRRERATEVTGLRTSLRIG